MIPVCEACSRRKLTRKPIDTTGGLWPVVRPGAVSGATGTQDGRCPAKAGRTISPDPSGAPLESNRGPLHFKSTALPSCLVP
eukprot:2198087-Prymnesium_polylepis.1